jgi:hypothetical protein
MEAKLTKSQWSHQYLYYFQQQKHNSVEMIYFAEMSD